MQEIVATPLGPIRVVTSGQVVRKVQLRVPGPGANPRTPLGRDLVRALSGQAVDFGRYAVDLEEFSPFERAVYAETRRIPRGEVRTYGQLAAALGHPGASRAVGNALGKNPACVVIPCHRIVAVNGLGGFTSGLRWKRTLLRIEGALRQSGRSATG